MVSLYVRHRMRSALHCVLAVFRDYVDRKTEDGNGAGPEKDRSNVRVAEGLFRRTSGAVAHKSLLDVIRRRQEEGRRVSSVTSCHEVTPTRVAG